jgi:integrase
MKNKGFMAKKAEEYITEKHGLGFKFESAASRLRKFAEYADKNAPGKSLTVRLVMEWADTHVGIKNQTKKGIFCALRGFAQFLLLDDPYTQLIPKRITSGNPRHTAPYIYSTEEIYRIMSTEPDPFPTRYKTLARTTILGLMACTGMRIGEVLALRKNEVNLKEGIITVFQFKKKPMRLIPIDETTVERLREYEKIRNTFHKHTVSDSFFLSEKGKSVKYDSIRNEWNEILRLTGIGKRRKMRPRFHDFRHTFACNHLLRAYRENRDIDDAVYMLSVYLGHTDIAGTYWYLSAIPALLELSAKRSEKISPKRRRGKFQ